ncbi:DEAH-box ATP-dependent RNA helicase prp22 [Rhizina undulata]
MDALADLQNLELLSLVSKITTELSNHLGINDKTLAEFVINLHDSSSSPADFKLKLAELGVEFPNSLAESIDRLILTMHPKHKNRKKDVEEDAEDRIVDLDKKSRVFKGLALPDRERPWSEDEYTETANAQPKNGKPDAIDDTLAMFEQLEGKNREEKKRSTAADDTFAMLESLDPARVRADSDDSKKRRRSPSLGNGRSSRRHRSRSRSKSRDRGKRKRYREDYDGGRDEFGRDRNGYGKGYGGGRRDRYDDDEFRRQPTPEVDNEPRLYKIYDGKVTGIKDFGAFVNLHGVKGKVDGLVHVSAIQREGRVNHPSDLLSRGQFVKVKVISIEGTRIGLSMKDVDQVSGRDLDPGKIIASGANMESMDGSGKGRYGNLDTDTVPVFEGEMDGKSMRTKKRLTSPERWEIKQLIASGAISALEYPDIDEEYNMTLTGEGEFEEEEDIDIEVRGDEPPFLAGQTKQSLELSPIRVVKAPDGSLNRAAMAGTSLAKERRELRQQQAADTAAEEAQKVDLNAQWQDPMVAPGERMFASELKNTRANKGVDDMPEWRRATMSKNMSFGKITSLSIKEQRESLPVHKLRGQLIKAVEENQLLIVVGDTGSGKTTQMTQYLAEARFADRGVIGCTQPRRVAAMSVAKRVAEEVGCRVGQEVGYTIRFEDCTSPETKIKYMTDGMLQREVLLDPDLKRYSVIMLDEAHERTIATDVLFGLLKKTLKRRPDLKLIVTSATLDAEKFSNYFNQCPIFTIPGRTYPVEILYTKEPESDYLDAALITVMQIHLSEPPGDILLFLTGQEEIDTSCEILYERMKALGPSVPELIILPVYSALPSEMQSKIFEPAPPGSRKVVIATNIAETSITIDQVYYVIDPGFVKQNAFDPKLGMDSLVVTPISQAQAKQRAGRAGRTGPGKCYRLYTEAAFQSEMLPTSIPEIQRQNLSHTILMLKAMGINDLLHFDFMDPPPTNTMLTALEELYALSALDDEGLLTRLGRKMADFPMEPALAKVLIASVDMGCSDEILSIVAMLSVQTVFYRPKEKQQQADQKKAKFHDPHGDHLTLLNVYNSWKNSGYSNPWCFDNFIQARSMKRAKDVRAQLEMIMSRYKHPIVSCGRNTMKVRQALCSGFFRNSARKDPQEGYKTLIEGTPVYMHPSSALFGKPAEHVIFHTLVMTTKEYMHCTTAIEPKWLVEVAPSFFKVGGGKGELSKRRKNERIQPLFNRFSDGDDSWRLSAQKRQGRGGGGGTWG